MPDSQEIPLIIEPCLRYSKTSPHPRKHASDIQELFSSRKRTGDAQELPLIQGNLFQDIQKLSHVYGMRNFITAFAKARYLSISKAD
jgi:hypothetical protein